MEEEKEAEAELDDLFGNISEEAKEGEPERQEEEEEEGEGEGEGEDMGSAQRSAEPPQQEEELQPVEGELVQFPELREGAFSHYLNLPVSLTFEHTPFVEERFAQHSQAKDMMGLSGLEKLQHTHPWRVVRWREKRGMDGELTKESNARLVTWNDGSQHLFIGDETVYEVTRQTTRRGSNDVYNSQQDTFVASFFAPLDEKLVFRLIKEPVEHKPKLQDKKARKVKMVATINEREEAKAIAEEEKKRAQSVLQKQREKRARQTSSVPLSRDFLEEPDAGDYGRGDVEEYEEDFVDDGGGSAQKRGKRVNEERLIEAKQSSRKSKVEDLHLYGEDDDGDEGDLEGFVVEDDDVEDDGGLVIDSEE